MFWNQYSSGVALYHTHTEWVPRICRLGLSASRSFRTILRKLSTNRLILWQWQAINSWSSASIAIHTYLKRATQSEYRQKKCKMCITKNYRCIAILTNVFLSIVNKTNRKVLIILKKLYVGQHIIDTEKNPKYPYLCLATSRESLSDRYAPIRSNFSGADRA